MRDLITQEPEGVRPCHQWSSHSGHDGHPHDECLSLDTADVLAASRARVFMYYLIHESPYSGSSMGRPVLPRWGSSWRSADTLILRPPLVHLTGPRFLSADERLHGGSGIRRPHCRSTGKESRSWRLPDWARARCLHPSHRAACRNPCSSIGQAALRQWPWPRSISPTPSRPVQLHWHTHFSLL